MIELTNDIYYKVTGLIYEAFASNESRTLFCSLDDKHMLGINYNIEYDDISIQASIIYEDGHAEGFFDATMDYNVERYGQYINNFRTACFTKLFEMDDLPY